MNVVVGVADCRISKDAGDVLITYALGSCIAVLIHDPIACVGGLLHFMLPASSSEALKSGKSPYMFADTGISLLFRQAYQAGAEKNRLRVGIAGGAQMIDGMDSFQIGKRNSLAARRILWIVSGHHAPAFTVASFATTTAGRPSIFPMTVTTPAAGA